MKNLDSSVEKQFPLSEVDSIASPEEPFSIDGLGIPLWLVSIAVQDGRRSDTGLSSNVVTRDHPSGRVDEPSHEVNC